MRSIQWNLQSYNIQKRAKDTSGGRPCVVSNTTFSGPSGTLCGARGPTMSSSVSLSCETHAELQARGAELCGDEWDQQHVVPHRRQQEQDEQGKSQPVPRGRSHGFPRWILGNVIDNAYIVIISSAVPCLKPAMSGLKISTLPVLLLLSLLYSCLFLWLCLLRQTLYG